MAYVMTQPKMAVAKEPILAQYILNQIWLKKYAIYGIFITQPKVVVTIEPKMVQYISAIVP